MISSRVVRSGAALFVSASALSLAACSGGGGGGNAAPMLVTKTIYAPCDSRFRAEIAEIERTQVEPAYPSTAAVTDWGLSDFFGKKYDRQDLADTLDLSIVSTALYVRSQGVFLRMIPNEEAVDNGACPTYSFIPQADKKLKAIWDKEAGGASGGMSLQGLFFEQNATPTILVNQTANRWTLIHEMMHFSFNQGRKTEDSFSPGTLRNGIKSVTAKYEKALKDFKEMPNRGDLSKAVAAVRELNEIQRLLGVQSSLEEITIESMLIARAATGELKNVNLTKGDVESSFGYMSFSRDRYVPELEALEDLLPPLKKLGDENFWSEIAEQVDETQALITKNIKEVEDVFDKTMTNAQKIDFSRTKGSRAPVGIAAPSLNDRLGVSFGQDEVDFDPRTSLEAIKKHVDSHDPTGLRDELSAAIHSLQPFSN